MVREEGVKSLFKGYWANTLAILLWMSLMPKVTNFLMEKLPLYIDPERLKETQDFSQQSLLDQSDDDDDD